MKDKNIYNNKEGFPKPGVSVDEAWNNMHELLVKNNLTKTPEKEKRRWLVWLILFLFTGLAGTIGYVSMNKNASLSATKKNSSAVVGKTIDTRKESSNNNQQKDSINKTVIENDSEKYDNKNNLAEAYSLKAYHKTIVAEPSSKINTADKPVYTSAVNNSVDVKKDYEHVNKNSFVNDSANVTAKNNDSVLKTMSFNSIDSNLQANNAVSKKNKATAKTKKDIFHIGLQWNINFALNSNNNYFNAYRDNNKQYYMWLLPSAWASVNIGKHQSVSLTVNPFKQQFAGSKIVHVEKPFIQSVEPDVITRLIKSRSIDLGVNYSYTIIKKLSVNVGANYSFQQNALYIEQQVEGFSGNILSAKIYGVRKKDEAFKYIKPSYVSLNTSLQYNFKMLSVGGGITSPLTNLSGDNQYNIKPVNGELFLRYRIK